MTSGTGAAVLPELEVQPGLLDTVRYAGAMWEFQRLHFDHEWARREGLDRAIVQGPLLGNYLVRAMCAGIPDGLELAEISWRNRAVVHVDERLRCGGTLLPAAADGSRAAELWIKDGAGTLVLTGSARLRSLAGADGSGR